MIRTYTATASFLLGDRIVRPGTIVSVDTEAEDRALREAHISDLRERPFTGWPKPSLEPESSPESIADGASVARRRRRAAGSSSVDSVGEGLPA